MWGKRRTSGGEWGVGVEMGPMVKHTALKYVILAYTLCWFGVIAPGHQRGVVQLPGGQSGSSPWSGDVATISALATGSCCTRRGENASEQEGQNSEGPRPDPARNCAICKLNATLDTPPTVIDVYPWVGLLWCFEPGEMLALAGVDSFDHFSIRGPPIQG